MTDNLDETAAAPDVHVLTARQPVYQCVKTGEDWHLTQEQATPPPSLRMGAYTSCGRWADFKPGFEKRRPTCAACAGHVAEWEKR